MSKSPLDKFIVKKGSKKHFNREIGKLKHRNNFLLKELDKHKKNLLNLEKKYNKVKHLELRPLTKKEKDKLSKIFGINLKQIRKGEYGKGFLDGLWKAEGIIISLTKTKT